MQIYNREADDFLEDKRKNLKEGKAYIRQGLFSAITHHRWWFLLLSLLLAIPLIAFNPHVETVNNVDYFRVEGNPDAQFYDEFKELFGGDEFFVIAFQSNNLFSSENLFFLREITNDIKRLEEVRKVTSLTSVEDIIGYEDYFEVSPFIDDVPENAEQLRALKNAAIRNSIFVGALISGDGNSTAIIIEAYEDAQDSDYKKKLIQKTLQILSQYEKKDIEFHLAGPVVTNYALSQYVNRDMSVFVPLTFTLIAFTIWFFFKNVRLTIAALLNIAVCVGVTRGFMGLAGITLNNVTSIVIPLVMALSLCDTVHIFSHMNKWVIDEFPDRFKSLAHVLQQVGRPCFMTTLTTGVGFLSLSISRIPPIREFAYAASAGMVFVFFFSFFFLPPLLLLFHSSKIYRDYNIHGGLSRALHRLGDCVYRKNRTIFIFSIILAVLAVFSATRVKVETNLIEFFKANSPIRAATNFVETNLSGVGTFDISLKAENETAFKEPSNLQVIESIQKFLETQKGADKTISFVDFLKDMNQSFHNEDPAFFRIPESRQMVAQYLLLYDSEDIEEFVTSRFDHARISVRISEHGSMRQKEMIDNTRDFINNMDRNNLDIRITGRAVNDINIVNDLVRGQVLSLGLASLIISLVMFFVFKSPGMAILSMVPNFFPIMINFGIMGFSGIPLNTGTALIAAVALGIAVDDTIHMLSEYQHQRSRGRSIPDSMKTATIIKGRAILSSSLILAMGFGITVLSQFVPIVHFGLLTALIMLTAVIGDLIVLPAIVYLKKDK